MSRNVSISIVAGDVRTCSADVLVLKYAQNFYGVDGVVHQLLPTPADTLLRSLADTGFGLSQTAGAIATPLVLFVGVQSLAGFGYAEIRDFARRALSYLARSSATTRHLAFTIHGPGYGLDESEAFQSELAGLFDAVSSGDFPRDLTSITFVELSQSRAERLQAKLQSVLPDGRLPVHDDAESLSPHAGSPADTLHTAGAASAAKPHIFVAMPFAEAMDDVFHYGIQGAVNAAGYLCERADLSIFTGDVMTWVRQRISSASLVIADLSSANPNVYLEVGYAWGRHIPTVLLARDAGDLKFDVKGQRCILYNTIKNLEDALARELRNL